MKKELPLPLAIDCSNLRQKKIRELAYRLKNFFGRVEVFDSEIEVSKPLDWGKYNTAWRVFDDYGVKVNF